MKTPVRVRLSHVGTAAAVLVAFVVGAMAGSSGTHTPPAGPSVVDEAAARIASVAAKPVDRASLDAAAIQAMLDKLGDRWATYYGPGDYAQLTALLEGRYSGLGVWLRRTEAGRVFVASVLPGSPAADALLVVGDELVSVADRDVYGTDLGWVVSQLRGPAGSSIALRIRRGATMTSLTLLRRAVATQDVTTDWVAPGVARIRVAAFTRGVGRDVRKAVAELRSARASGVVLDLRGNPGGLLSEGVEVASAFLDGGPVVSYAGRGAKPRLLSAPAHGNTDLPLAVLVDSGTASAAEVVTGALQDRGRAVVVGSRTFGKGSVQEPMRLSDGSAIELTVARYLTPSGRSLDGVGISPDIALPDGADDASAVRRAVDVLAGLVADAGTSGFRGRG